MCNHWYPTLGAESKLKKEIKREKEKEIQKSGGGTKFFKKKKKFETIFQTKISPKKSVLYIWNISNDSKIFKIFYGWANQKKMAQ